MGFFLSSDEQGIVVFSVWKSLAYVPRMLLGFGFIFAGFIVQYILCYRHSVAPWLYHTWLGRGGNILGDVLLEYILYLVVPGAALVLIGSLFLLVRGYDNRVSFGKYKPSAGWEQVEEETFQGVERLVKKMKKWDRSIIDTSNPLGKFIFVLILIVLGALAFGGVMDNNLVLLIVAVDACLLVIPLWNAGKRDFLTKPNLLLKIHIIKNILKRVREELQSHQVEFFMLLWGWEERKIPEDVKFKIDIQDHHTDFLGLYGQIVTNSVSGRSYPYFYVVLVAKKGFGLQHAFEQYKAPRKITKDYSEEEDVEVLVIRQTTTQTSGYHTKPGAMRRIFLEGLQLAEQNAVKI